MTKAKLKLTEESLVQAIKPPNSCQVKRVRDSLSEEEQVVLDKALALDHTELSGKALRQWLKDNGIEDAILPSADHVAAHRSGTRPCRCRD